jgi:integrase
MCQIGSSAFELKSILEAIDRMDIAAAQCLPGSIMEASHKRNALLFAFLLSNPLRGRSITSLTWITDGLGSLRGSPAKGWRISLTAEQLKNGNSKHGKRYDVKVADWIKTRLDAYIEEYRSTLLRGKESRYLFVGDKKGGIWNGVGATVRKVSRKYIPGCPGFGPHSFRHLVATDGLRRYPGDYLTVAELLGDRIELCSPETR